MRLLLLPWLSMALTKAAEFSCQMQQDDTQSHPNHYSAESPDCSHFQVQMLEQLETIPEPFRLEAARNWLMIYGDLMPKCSTLNGGGFSDLLLAMRPLHQILQQPNTTLQLELLNLISTKKDIDPQTMSLVMQVYQGFFHPEHLAQRFQSPDMLNFLSQLNQLVPQPYKKRKVNDEMEQPPQKFHRFEKKELKRKAGDSSHDANKRQRTLPVTPVALQEDMQMVVVGEQLEAEREARKPTNCRYPLD